MDKRKIQLGMNPSTASNRLVKDILFKYISKCGETCFRCNFPMQRENFSIEHKTPWLDSESPAGLFFDLDNIAFSHLSCNFKAARKPTRLPEDQRENVKVKRREYKRQRERRLYTSERRHEKYLRNEK